MASNDLVRIVFKTDAGELNSEVQTESLPVWLEIGWELAPDFLADEEAAAEAVPEFDYGDWIKATKGAETKVADSDKNVVVTDEEN